MFILTDRERRREWVGKGQRESQAGSVLSVQSLKWGSNSQTVRSRPEPKSKVRRSVDWATHAPQNYYLWDRESGEGQRGDKGSEVGSVLTAVSWTWGSNSQTMRSRPESKLDAQLTEPPRCLILVLECKMPVQNSYIFKYSLFFYTPLRFSSRCTYRFRKTEGSHSRTNPSKRPQLWGHSRKLVETLETKVSESKVSLKSVASSLLMERIHFCSFMIIESKSGELKNYFSNCEQ